MPGTFTQLLVHLIFSTKHRQPWISDRIEDRLYAYMGGIIRSEGGTLFEIGGAPDHVHLYVRCKADVSISDLMRIVKSKSSRWMHESFADLGAFAWQEGYTAFSVSRSQEDAVRTYIRNQRAHHARRDLKEELRRLLEAHGVEFDERYLVD